jgi:hypothetical protein
MGYHQVYPQDTLEGISFAERRSIGVCAFGDAALLDGTEVVRLVRWSRSSGTRELTYEIVDPRFGDPIAQHLILEVLLRGPMAAEFGDPTLPVRYTNAACDSK